MTLASASVLAGDEITIAVAGPMSGQYAAYGEAMRQGAAEAVARLEAAGTKLRLIVEDDACDKTRAVAAAHRLVAANVAIVIGHHCAGASLAAAPHYAAAGIVMISPGTTDPQLTDKRAGPTIFRLSHRNDREGAVAGAYIAKAFAGKRVAILHDRTVVGMALAADARKAMIATGLREAMYTGFIAGEPDYSRLAQDMKAHRIDAIFLGAYPNEVDLILTALRRLGEPAAVIASSLLAVDVGDEAKSRLRDGLLLTAVAGTPAAVAARTGAAIDAWSKATAAASEAPATGSAIARALQAGNFATAVGEISFDAKGDPKVPFVSVQQWRGGQLGPAP